MESSTRPLATVLRVTRQRSNGRYHVVFRFSYRHPLSYYHGKMG